MVYSLACGQRLWPIFAGGFSGSSTITVLPSSCWIRPPVVELGRNPPIDPPEAVRAFVRSRHSTRWLELAAMLCLRTVLAVTIRWCCTCGACRAWPTRPASFCPPSTCMRRIPGWLSGAGAPHPDDGLRRRTRGGLHGGRPKPPPPTPDLRASRRRSTLRATGVPSSPAEPLAGRLGRRRLEDAFLIPRLAGFVGSPGLLATSTAHVVITSHLGGAVSFGPLLVLGSLFAIERALGARDGRWLVPGGALSGWPYRRTPRCWRSCRAWRSRSGGGAVRS